MLCIKNEQEVRVRMEENRGEGKALRGKEGGWIGIYNRVMKGELGSYKSSC